MTILDLVFILAAVITVTIFSVLATQAEQSLWRSCRRRCNCPRLQRQITMGKAHCR
jgi:hypothetical protein